MVSLKKISSTKIDNWHDSNWAQFARMMHDLSQLSFYIIPLFLCLQFWKDTWLLHCQILVQMLLQFVSNCNSHWSTQGHGSRISLNKMACQPMPGPKLKIYFCVNLVMKDYKEYNKGYGNICLLPWDVSRLSWCMVLQLWCVCHNHLDSYTLAAPCSESSLDSTTVCSSFASFPVKFVPWYLSLCRTFSLLFFFVFLGKFSY